MQLPDGPQTPAILQMIHWIAKPFSYMEACNQNYGDIFTVPLGKKFTPIVFVSNPQALQQILTSDTKEFDASGEYNGLFEPMLGKQSVISLSGESHRRQRQLMMPPFHGERMKAYGQLITEITEQVITQWEVGKPISIRSFMQQISLRVILQAVFGLYEGERYQKLEQLLSTMLDQSSSPGRVSALYFPILRQDLGKWSPWGCFLRQRQEIDQLIYAEINERREPLNVSGTDILSLLMSAHDQTGQPMTDEELRDELMTLLVAGHETTATALTWALYWIHKLPEVRQNLLEELDSIDNPDPSMLFRLPYLNAVCSETLRIYPVGMLTFPRVVRSPVELMGYQLEPDTVLVGCIYLTHQRQDLYPEPKQFKPERFLEHHFSPYEYLPFGGGARRCLGMAFAQFEMKIVLAKILSSCELALANNRPVRPVRRGLVSAPTDVQLVVTSQRVQRTPTPETISV
ncbi:MAG: cytochrome P450 [Coleofasciculus chthonoplastes F3-SA18-01]|uniref:cytochrome P450 n=1 Tax=Coleofasciculus chthonoplastes TaxID=64178 RepID=UPI0032FC78CB